MSPQGGQNSKSSQSPQGTNSKPTVVAATAISKIQLDNVFKNSLYSLLQHEVPYADIMKELLGGTRQIKKNNLIFRRMNELLVADDENQDVNLDFWRVVVPDNIEIKEQIVRELHSTPYNPRPGIQRTIAKVRRSFC